MELVVRRALSVRSATNPRLGSGGVVYYLSDFTGVMQLWRFDGSTHDAVFPWEGRIGDYKASPTGIAFTSDVNGDEKWRLYLLRDEIIPISAEGINSLGAFSPDGIKLAFTSTKDAGSDFHLYIWDGSSLARVAEMPGINVVEQWSEAGILITHYETNLDSAIYLYDGQLKELTPHSGEALNYSPRYVGGKLYFLTNQQSEYVGLAVMDISTGSWKYLIQLDRDVEAFDIWGQYIAFTLNEGGISGLYLMHMPSGLTHKINTPPGVVTSLEFKDGKILMSISSINKGHEVYVYQGGVLRQLTNSPKFGLRLDTLPEPQSLWYPTHDGRKIQAWLYKPASEPRGVVVYLHGGPESQDRPEFTPLKAALLAAGYIVAAPNYRGSSGFGKTFFHLDDVEKRWDAIRDVESFAKWLIEQGVTKKKPCVLGGSYGGYLALMALAIAPDLWSCGVEIMGIFNLVTFLERTAPFRRKYREAEYGSLEKHHDILIQLSPVTHVEKVQTPLMVIHGANDIRVPVYEAEQLVQKLKELGRPVEALILPDEGHGISKVENRIKAYTEAIRFINKYLAQ